MNLQFKELGNPILILSDAPEQLTGLARIGHDLAGLLSTLPQFRVGYMGMGGVGRLAFPWASYSFPQDGQWGAGQIQEIWSDFSAGENGIVFSLWDASRMLWFTKPAGMDARLQRSLGEGRNFEKWGYFPVDGVGPDGIALPVGMAAAVDGYDRVLAASDWGRGVLRQTCSDLDKVDWLPHGIWTDKFKPEFKSESIGRSLLGWGDKNKIVLGCNMANQARKDWPVAFECAAHLKVRFGNRFHFWVHTDELIRYWNFYALAADYGVQDCLEITTRLTDEQLALRYSACDCTILPSGGEGFSFPTAESLSCGTPCVVTGYAAGAELVPESCRVEPVEYRIDTIHNVKRAVLSGWAFADHAELQIEKKREDWTGYGDELRESVSHLDWNKLATLWTKWLLEKWELK